MSAVRISSSGAAEAAFGRRRQAGHGGQDAGGGGGCPAGDDEHEHAARDKQPLHGFDSVTGAPPLTVPGSAAREHVAARLLGSP